MEDERKTKKQLIEELNCLRLEQIEQTKVNQEKFTKAFLQSSLSVAITTVKEDRFIDVSNAFLRLVGYRREEVIGHTSRDVGFITEAQRVFLYNELNKKGCIEDLEMELSPKGRGLRYGLFNVVMMSLNNENYLLTTIQDITDRKQAEENLKQSENMFALAFLKNSIPSAITTVKEGRYIEVSEEFLKLMGIERSEMIGNTSTGIGFITPEQRQLMLNEFRQKGSVVNLELQIRTKGGELRHGLFNSVKISLSGDDHLLTVVTDITDRKRAEENIRILAGLSDISPLSITVHDLQGNFLYANQKAFDMHGYSQEEFLARNLHEIDVPASAAMIEARMKIIMETHETQFEVEHCRKDGTCFPLEVFVQAAQWGGKDVLLSVASDITDRKRTEKKLKQQTDAMEAAIEGIAILNETGEYVYLNKAHANIYGYDNSGELIGKSWTILYDSDELQRFEQKIMPEFHQKKHWHGEAIGKKADGRKFPQELSLTHLDSGGLICVVRDITERKRSEEMLVKSEEKFRLITENMLDCVALVDVNGIYQYVTPSHRETLGYDPEDMIGITGFSITHPDDLEQVTRLALEGIEQGWREAICETRIRHKDGHYVPMETRARVLNDQQGKFIGGVFAGRDITQRKQMEEELLRAHKMESLGVLAGGIAHDFNNLMTVVQGNIELALMDLPPDHASRQRLQTAMRSVTQTQDLTSRMITFSRGGGPVRVISNIAEILRDAVHRKVRGTKVRVTFDFMEHLWPTEVDNLQMRQVFYNLMTNALEAMPEGGNLMIRAKNALMPSGEVLELKEGSYLKITFADEGIGIPAEHRAKIFDPYFTTKNMGAQKGLGLGLAVCYSVLKNHGGHITVESPPGKGASFVLYIPARPDLLKEKDIKKTLSTGTVRILIMDDELLIREIEREHLELLGHEVTDVKDGQEAIDTYKKALDSSNPFDLVILSLTVRDGLGGKLAMEHLLKIDPSIKAIITYGFIDDPVIENYTGYGFMGILKKPFRAEEIKSLLEKILNG